MKAIRIVTKNQPQFEIRDRQEVILETRKELVKCIEQGNAYSDLACESLTKCFFYERLSNDYYTKANKLIKKVKRLQGR